MKKSNDGEYAKIIPLKKSGKNELVGRLTQNKF
jgi:hypothetical protein